MWSYGGPHARGRGRGRAGSRTPFVIVLMRLTHMKSDELAHSGSFDVARGDSLR